MHVTRYIKAGLRYLLRTVFVFECCRMTENPGLDLLVSGTSMHVTRPIEVGLRYLFRTVLAFEYCTHQHLGV